MAVRSPMKLSGSDLQEMTSSEITAIQTRARYLYAQNPSVTLSYASGNNGNLGAMTDTRKQASGFNQNAFYHAGLLGTQFAGASIGFTQQGAYSVNTLGTISNTYDYLNQSIASTSQPSDNGLSFPLYWDGSALRAMSATDMYDTFILPAATGMSDGSDRGGTFRMHNNPTLNGHTQISSNPIFVDTAFSQPAVAYTSPVAFAQFAPGFSFRRVSNIGSINASASTNVSFYYLLRSDDTSNPSYTLPMYYDGSNTVQEYTQSNFDTILSGFIRHTLANVSGYRLRYSINGSGNQRGITATDFRLNSFQYIINNEGPDDYRAQVVPAGSLSAIQSYALRLTQV